MADFTTASKGALKLVANLSGVSAAGVKLLHCINDGAVGVRPAWSPRAVPPVTVQRGWGTHCVRLWEEGGGLAAFRKRG